MTLHRTMTQPLKPPRTDASTHTLELTGQKTGDTPSDHEVAIQTLEKDWDSNDATIYTDGAATHGNANGGSAIIVTTAPPPQVTIEFTVSALSRPANGARPSKPTRKLCEQPSIWYNRMLPSQGAHRFR